MGKVGRGGGGGGGGDSLPMPMYIIGVDDTPAMLCMGHVEVQPVL